MQTMVRKSQFNEVFIKRQDGSHHSLRPRIVGTKEQCQKWIDHEESLWCGGSVNEDDMPEYVIRYARSNVR